MARKTSRTGVERLEYRVTRLLKEAQLIAKTAGDTWTQEMAEEAESAIYSALEDAFDSIRRGEKPVEKGFKFSRNLQQRKVA
ncbi:MAG: hypothetical protein WCS15_00220 [Prevotella sp.]|nr:hypothetical protein [Massilibacteroides sp.]